MPFRLRMVVDGKAHPEGGFDLVSAKGTDGEVTIGLLGVSDGAEVAELTIVVPFDEWQRLVLSVEETRQINRGRSRRFAV